MLVGILTSSGSFALRPGSMLDPDPRQLPPVNNPFALESAAALGLIEAASLPLALLAPAPLVALFVRYRRARGDERQQIKWVAYAAALLTVAAVVVSVFPSLDGTALGGAMFLAAYVAVPAAVGVAILRYRLYDIDVIINRTLVYAALTAMLVVTYLGGVVLSQGILRALIGQESQLVVVGSTLLIAMLFNPLRRLVQSFIDRLFYRKKYNAQRTLREFGARLSYRTDLESLDEELISTVRETMQPEHVSMWLRTPTGRRENSTIGEVRR